MLTEISCFPKHNAINGADIPLFLKKKKKKKKKMFKVNLLILGQTVQLSDNFNSMPTLLVNQNTVVY